jgi:hypothetical protein
MMVGQRISAVPDQVSPSSACPTESGTSTNATPHTKPSPATAAETPAAARVHCRSLIVARRRANSGMAKLSAAMPSTVAGPRSTWTPRNAPTASRDAIAAMISSVTWLVPCSVAHSRPM